MKSIAVVFITHFARNHLLKALPPVLNSPLHPEVLVVNSSSHDGTVELAELLGAKTLVIPREEFNHGTTRERARKQTNSDIVVMMTPDAYGTDPSFLKKLVEPLLKEEASVSYAKQIPHDGAGLFERFSRQYNYGDQSQIRALRDLDSYGVYTYFCSNACAAYTNQALDEMGGFPAGLFGEDTRVVAKLLQKGHKIAYVADAVVQHSHNYSLMQEFRRHFDIGYSRKELDFAKKGDLSRGFGYTKKLLQKVWNEVPHLIPYALLQTGVKYLGYQIGKRSHSAPLWFKKSCSSQDYYWKKDF